MRHWTLRSEHCEHAVWPMSLRVRRSHLILRRWQKSHDSRTMPRRSLISAVLMAASTEYVCVFDVSCLGCVCLSTWKEVVRRYSGERAALSTSAEIVGTSVTCDPHLLANHIIHNYRQQTTPKVQNGDITAIVLRQQQLSHDGCDDEMTMQKDRVKNRYRQQFNKSTTATMDHIRCLQTGVGHHVFSIPIMLYSTRTITNKTKDQTIISAIDKTT